MATHSPRPNTKPSTTAATIIIALAMFTFPIAPALGITTSDPLGQTWEQVEKITPDDSHKPAWNGYPSHTNVKFGGALSVDGDKLIVGTTPTMSDPINWVYIFQQNGEGEWEQVVKLDDAPPFSTYGHDVDIDAERGIAVVGAPGYNREGPDTAEDQDGLVYVYEETASGSWKLTTTLQGIDDGESSLGARFGFSVFISEGIIGVSAPSETSEVGPLAGAVHLFEKGTNGEWERAHRIVPEDQDPRGAFGATYDAIDLVDGILVAAAPGEIPSEGDGGWGAVYLFEEVDGSWEQIQRIAPDVGPGGCHGATLSLGEERLAVGDGCRWNVADRESPLGLPVLRPDAAVYIYEEGPEQWELEAILQGSDRTVFHDNFAIDVELSGDTLAVGASHYPSWDFGSMGVVYVFEFDGEEWMETAKIRADDTFFGDQFGRSVDFQGDGTLLVGAPKDNNRQDGWPHPLGHYQLPVIQGMDGWNAGSVFEFSLKGGELIEATLTKKDRVAG